MIEFLLGASRRIHRHVDLDVDATATKCLCAYLRHEMADGAIVDVD